MTWLSVLNRKLIRDLAHMSGQGIAVGMIIACGVAILVMALGTLSSLQNSRDIYYNQYRFADIFADVKRAPLRLVSDIERIEGVRLVEARISRIVTLDIMGLAEPANAQLISLPVSGRPALNDVYLYEGRWPEASRPDEAIVSKAFTEAHDFEVGDHVTALINGRARQVEIVGIGDSPEFIYLLGPGALLPDEERFGVFWMGQNALEAAFDLDGAFNSILIDLSPNAIEADIITDLDRLLKPYGATGAYARDDQVSYAFIASEMQQMASTARIIPPVFLVVSALLINAILSRLIATERQQVGLLKAFGYSKGEIGWHYIKFGLLLSLGGVVLGFGLGAALARLMTYLYSDSFRFPEIVFSVSPAAFVISGAAAFAAAIAGAFNAAMGAAALQPAEAMSPAPPTVYRRGRLQSSAFIRGLDEPTRMILRHLTRWPLRAGTTAFGVAAAMALLVGTLFAFDSIDAVIEDEFYRSNPSDATVRFAEPLDSRALLELERLDGVLTVEPLREAFVRYRYNHVSERGVLTGLPAQSDLKTILADADTVTTPAADGLVVSSQLASMLGAGLGDLVQVESLEGRRRVTQLPIISLSSDGIGAGAYMEINGLNQALGESSLSTGAMIAVDPDQQSALSRQVLDRPMIASVSTQRAVLDSFEGTLRETIYIMMGIYALIGGAIAAGVVYNAARISLTERGRELASLRVLGFTEREVSYILIGELAILVLIGLPIGAVAGAGLAWTVATGMATELYRIPYTIDPSTYGLCVSVILIASATAAVLVARRVSKLDLIEVLKTRE